MALQKPQTVDTTQDPVFNTRQMLAKSPNTTGVVGSLIDTTYAKNPSEIINNPGGNIGMVQFNVGGSFGGDRSFIYNQNTKTLSLSGNINLGGYINGRITTNLFNFNISGGSNGYILQTDGNGNLSWQPQAQIQYGDSNVANYLPNYSGNLNGNNSYLGGSLFSHNILTGNATIGNANITSTLNIVTGANLDVDVSQLMLTGGANGDYLSTDGTGNLTWKVPATVYGNANVSNYLPNYTGNITANSITTNGTISTIGRVLFDSTDGTASIYDTLQSDGGIFISPDEIDNMLWLPGANNIQGTQASLVGFSNVGLLIGSTSTKGVFTSNIALTTGINSGNYTWTFDSSGNLTFPDNTVQSTAWTGTVDAGNVSNLIPEIAAVVSTLSGNVSASNITAGNVTANFISALNIGNVAALNYDGNASNILYGNGVFSNVPLTYGDSNVVTLLNNLGTNTISTSGSITSNSLTSTSNVQVGQFITTPGATDLMLLPATQTTRNYGNLDPYTGGFYLGGGSPWTGINAGTGNFTGNITASYLVGNGSQLTGLPASYTDSNVANYLPTYPGTLTGNLLIYTETNTGAPTVGTRTSGSRIVLYPLANTAGYADYGIGIDVNTQWYGIPQAVASQSHQWYGGSTQLMSLDGTGNLTVTGSITANNLTVNGSPVSSYTDSNVAAYLANNVPTGTYNDSNVASYLSNHVPTGTYTNSNVSSYLSTANISTTGNITAAYLVGNGSQLTGLPASYANSNVATFLGNFGSNTITTTGNVTVGNIIATNLGNLSALNKDGNASNILYGNGVFAAPASVYGDSNVATYLTNHPQSGTYSNSNVTTLLSSFGSNSISTTGNVTAAYIIGNGSQLTGLPASYANSNVASYLPTYTGNLTANYANFAGNLILSSTSKIVSVSGSNGNITLDPDGTGVVNIIGNVVANNLTSGNLNVSNINISGSPASYAVTNPVTGSAYLATSVNIPTSATTSSSATTIMSFTLPGAGVWEVTYFVRAQGTAGFAAEFALFDPTGTLVANSEILPGYGTSGSTGSGSIFITTSSSATYTIKGWDSNSMAWVATSDSNGRTGATWVQINAPITVQATATGTLNTNFAKYTRSSGQTTNLTSNNIIVCNVLEASSGSDISVNTSTGQVTLAAGKSYRLRGGVPDFTASANTARPQFCWFNETSSSWIGESSAVYSPSDAATYGATGGPAEAIITTSTSTVVSFRILSVSGTTLTQLGGSGDFSLTGSYPWIDIEEINTAFSLNGIQNLSWPTGNVTSGNANLGNLVTANYFSGTLTTQAQPNITSVGTLSSVVVSGSTSVGNAVSQSAPSGGNILVNATFATGGNGGNWLSFGQYDSGNNYAMWMQAGFANSIQSPYNIVMQPIGGKVIIGNVANNSSTLTVSGTITATGNITATAATATTSSAANSVGYIGMPQNSQSTGYTLAIGDMGKHVYVSATATITVPANSSVAFPIGTTIAIIAGSGATATIAITTDTMYLAGSGTTGSRTLAAYGMATLVKVASTTWFISGAGLT